MSSDGINNRSSSAKDDDHARQVNMFAMSPSSSSSSGVLIAETSREQQGRRRLLLNEFNSSSSASHISTQQQQKLQTYSGPCLSCLMRALQSSGLLNSCWSAAFTELEEAFAIKRIADAMTGEDGGGAAGASKGSKSPQQQPPLSLFRQKQKLHGPQFGTEGLPLQAATFRWQHQQLPVVRQAATTGPGMTKWHALESLCSLMSDIGECQHRAGGGGY